MDELAKFEQLFQKLKVARIDEIGTIHKQIGMEFSALSAVRAYTVVSSWLNGQNSTMRFYAVRLAGENRITLATNDLFRVLQSDDDDDIRGEAAIALGELGADFAVQPLIKVLKNTTYEWPVRASAAIGLGNFNTPEVIEALLFVLVDDYNIETYFCEWIVASLVKIGGDVVSAKLLAILAEVSISDSVLFAIIDALGRLKSKASVSTLLKLLSSHEDPEVRATAAVALGRIGDTSAIPALRVALLDYWKYTRRCASEALRKLSS